METNKKPSIRKEQLFIGDLCHPTNFQSHISNLKPTQVKTIVMELSILVYSFLISLNVVTKCLFRVLYSTPLIEVCIGVRCSGSTLELL